MYKQTLTLSPRVIDMRVRPIFAQTLVIGARTTANAARNSMTASAKSRQCLDLRLKSETRVALKAISVPSTTGVASVI